MKIFAINTLSINTYGESSLVIIYIQTNDSARRFEVKATDRACKIIGAIFDKSSFISPFVNGYHGLPTALKV